MGTFVLGVVVGVLINLITAFFSRRHALGLIPWLMLYIAIHGSFTALRRDALRSWVMQLARRYPGSWSYLVVVLIVSSLAVLYWKSVRMLVSELDRRTQPNKPESRTSSTGGSIPGSKNSLHTASPSPITSAEMTPPYSAIEKLGELGWTIKPEAKDIKFEITDRIPPNMQKSASYFRTLRKPFYLHLQQVPTLAGFRFLSGVNNCVGVEISASNLLEISELRGLTSLRSLIISQTPFNSRDQINIDAVASLVNLETLNLNMSRVNNLESLRGLKNLTSLNVGGSLVKDISPIKGLKLKSLDVRDSSVVDVSLLSGDEALEELSVDAKQVPSLTYLSQLPRFSRLSIISQIPVQLAAVGALSHLRALFIWGPPIIDLSPVRKLKGLERLQVSGFGLMAERTLITDPDAIGALPHLTALILGQVQIDSVRFLSSCANLVELNLSGVPITSAPEFANLTSLKRIYLIDVPLVDISPLLSLRNLEKMSILRTPARADVISELERRGVKVTVN